MKQLLTLTFLSLFGIVHAQIPSYVPSNGLVGWWPFNGNANDEGGNGNNGTVNGATLTFDRNGVANNAYSFDGVNDVITVNSIGQFVSPILSISVFIKPSVAQEIKFIEVGDNNSSNWSIYTQNDFAFGFRKNESCVGFSQNQFLNQVNNEWSHLIIITDSFQTKLYKNGILINTMPSTNFNSSCPLSNMNIGLDILDQQEYWNGLIDDIGIWNRALTEAEILALYEGCQLAITTQPQDQSVTTSVGTASFTVASSSANATYQWQTNLGLGYQNISNAGQYSGATSASLSVSNLSMANDNQVFRCIVNDGSCADTTAEATLTIIDDAGIQNITVSSIKLYPNPAQDVLYIDGLVGKEFEYEVLSIEGKLLQKGKSQGEIAVKELKKGNYVLRIGQQQVAFVKQ